MKELLLLAVASLISFCHGSPYERDGGQWLTTGGAKVNTPCVFPFKARGITYTECTKAGGFSIPWCSTMVDASGNTVIGNWGDCPVDDPDCYPTSMATTTTTTSTTTAAAADSSGDCLTIGGAKVGVSCVFPFKTRGITYTECTYAGGYSTPWCSTMVDGNGETVLGNWGDCPISDECFPSSATTLPAETSPAAAQTTAAVETTAAAETTVSGPCLTNGGAKVGVPCVF